MHGALSGCIRDWPVFRLHLGEIPSSLGKILSTESADLSAAHPNFGIMVTLKVQETKDMASRSK